MRPVERVAVLALTSAPGVRHGFRCRTSSGSSSDLRWVKGGTSVRFVVSRTVSFLEMDLSSPQVTSSDEGNYTCATTDGSESITIFISAGK